MDDRQLYESCLQPGEQPCIISGYPIRKQAVTFSKSSFQCNKDVWSKICMGAKISPESNLPSILSFINKWCGVPTN